jgi:DNA polymerase-3 subunit delta'
LSPDDEPVAPLPRETHVLFGHAEAERALLDAYRSGRIHHAWLIAGPLGIGKATLAYRMARFVLANPDPAWPNVRLAQSLAIESTHPVSRRIAAQAQGDLLVLERTIGERGALRTRIAVDDVRRSVSFFGSTAGEGGWRIAIVDSVDELNDESANALLKILEEPPARSLLLLISHAPGRVLPTIRSRCRYLPLRPLSQQEVALAAATALGRDASEQSLQEAAAAAEGSAARALMLLDGAGLALRHGILQVLDRLPSLDPNALHALGDSIAGTEPQTLAVFLETIAGWLSSVLRSELPDLRRLARVAEAWDKINQTARDAATFNLERKPMVFRVFGILAEVARR